MILSKTNHDFIHLSASSVQKQVFSIPLLDCFLLYAPLHNLVAIVDSTSLDGLRASFTGQATVVPPTIHNFLKGITEVAEPEVRQGEIVPSALGIITTRSCNLACRYCGFLPESGQNKIALEKVQHSVNWYMDQVANYGLHQAEIHFFGGEPFAASDVIDLAVHLGRKRAAEIGCELRFEVATNGTFNEERCRWIADNIDTVVLSFDGKPELHDKHRPRRNQKGSFEAVARNAKILSEGATSLAIRCCITDESVSRIPELAAWFCETYQPDAIGFEPLQPTRWSEDAQLSPPDPWDFARNFIQSAALVEKYGVELVYATTDINTKQISFCPVAKDFIIIGADGSLNACYLRRYEWEDKGIDLELGQISSDGDFQFDAEQVAFARSQNVYNKPLCQTCFCKWHCAGGCHVNHELGTRPGDYDRLCIQSRVITLYNILKSIGKVQLMDALLEDEEALYQAIFQASDLINGEEFLL